MKNQLQRASQLGQAQQLLQEVQHLQPWWVQVPVGSEEPAHAHPLEKITAVCVELGITRPKQVRLTQPL